MILHTAQALTKIDQPPPPTFYHPHVQVIGPVYEFIELDHQTPLYSFIQEVITYHYSPGPHFHQWFFNQNCNSMEFSCHSHSEFNEVSTTMSKQLDCPGQCKDVSAIIKWSEINTLRLRQNGYLFSWMKVFEFRLEFNWSLFLGVQLTIFHHWFR